MQNIHNNIHDHRVAKDFLKHKILIMKQKIHLTTSSQNSEMKTFTPTLQKKEKRQDIYNVRK